MLFSAPSATCCAFPDPVRRPVNSDAAPAADLFSMKAAGADVRIVYSPMDAVQIAKQNPGKQVVFFAVGFETTAPANAMSVYQARTMRPEELFGAGFACAGAACDGGHPEFAGQLRARLSGCRPRLHHHGLHRVLPDCRQISRAHRSHRLRTARSAARNLHVRAATGAGTL